MKARVKATGEIFDIEVVSLRLTGKVLSSFGLDEVEVLMPDLTPDYWTRLEHQAAIAAMQAIVTNCGSHDYASELDELLVTPCIEIAHALVEKYKKEK